MQTRKPSFTNEEFADAIKSSVSWAEVIRKLGLQLSGNRYIQFKKLAIKLQIDTNHILGRSHWFGQKIPQDKPWGIKWPNEAIFVEHSKYKGRNQVLKKRLIDLGLKEDKCDLCPTGPTWNGKPLVLQLDHINGYKNDLRPSNLRIICPNCHSQTETFCSKNIK